jgi:CheY-like chemotaxis protein
VLVVEDQEAVRSFAGEALRSYGYRVLEASMGGEALLLVESHPEPIHLMLTDVVMPHMTGIELAARVRPLRPNMRVLYMSGYADRGVALDEDGEGGMEFIAKPFSPDTLAAKVRAVLGVPGSRGRILVVEEDEGVRELFETVLSGEGYEVFLACDGDRATKLLWKHPFHLVITDVAAKDLQQRALIGLLRSQDGDQKILALSSGFRKSSSPSADKLGANATLLRPVHPEQLLTTVAELLA